MNALASVVTRRAFLQVSLSASGALVLAQYTTWDTENDAREFFDAYCERTENRYKVVRPANSNTSLRVYETNEGLASIELRGNDVVIMEGPTTREQLSRASDQVWKSKKAIGK